MSVVLSIEDIGPCKKELKIEVPGPEVEAETERLVRDYGRKVKLPGFRPGKVPPGVVRRRFREEIDRDVVERLVPRYWSRAEAEAGLDPVTQPELAGVEERTAGEPLVFTARVEIRPEIELGDLTGFEIPDPPAEPTDEEVQSALEELRSRAGEWKPVDRPAGQSDRVSVEIEERPAGPEAAGEGGQAGEGRAPEAVEVEVGSPQVWEELSVALTGLSAGQQGEFSRMHEDEGEVRERSFRFQVREVREQELPELDDELAGRIGGFASVAELADDVRARLAQQKRAERAEARERALLDQLRARHPVPLPEGLVDREIEGMVRDYAESLARQGVDVERSGIEWRSVAEQARPAAEKRVHGQLILDAVARARGLEVAPEELEVVLAQIARAQRASTAAVRRALDADGRLARLRGQLRRSKTVRHLLGEEGEEAPGKSGGAGGVEGSGESPQGADPDHG